MTLSTTARLALTRWSANTDRRTRAQIDGNFAQIEELAVKRLRGPAAARPAAGPAVAGCIYEVSDDGGRLDYCDGSAWRSLTAPQRAVSVDGPVTIGAAFPTLATLDLPQNVPATVIARGNLMWPEGPVVGARIQLNSAGTAGGGTSSILDRLDLGSLDDAAGSLPFTLLWTGTLTSANSLPGGGVDLAVSVPNAEAAGVRMSRIRMTVIPS